MVEVTDFWRSYMSWDVEWDPNDKRVPGHMPWGNSVRILIDARCTIEDGAGAKEEFYLIAPCRTEWMYRENDLIQIPSGEYRVIFSQERQLAVGKKIAETDPRPGSVSTATFPRLEFTITPAPARVLETNEAVGEASRGIDPIVVKTEFADTASGLRATLEYPVRTMNYHPERVRFQVDTGPLIFPVLNAETEHLIDRCALAHTVYNTFDYGEFICKRSTPVLIDGAEVATAFHYSEVHRLDVRHTIFAAGS